jgi:adenylate cyclase
LRDDITPEEHWRLFFTGEHPDILRARRMFTRMPSNPRCKVCAAPFRGIGHRLIRRFGFVPWSKNPNVCSRCVTYLADLDTPGAEIDASFVFADVRGSTEMAGTMSPSDFSKIMNRFYRTATKVLLDSDALVDKFVGDEVIGLYLPGIAGTDHPRHALAAAEELLRATGHDGEPWVPIGIGVHTGTAFVGRVGETDQISDFTALGDEVNLAARLASAAGTGEIIVSDAVLSVADPDGIRSLERRDLTLKGIADPVPVSVVTVAAGTPTA